MGKFFETLQQANGKHHASGIPAPAPAACPPAVPISTSTDDEIPFIEVGGNGPRMEASAAVQAARPAGTVQHTPHPATESIWPAPHQPAAEEDTTAVGVTFQPLPSAAAPWAPARDRFAPELVAFHKPEHPVSRQYQTLWSGITAQLPAGGTPILLFIAGISGVGTTTVALNLAITSARQGQGRVVVVEANLARPAVAGRLVLAHAPGLCEVLAGQVSLQRALQDTGLPNLQVLVAGKALEEDGTLLAGDAMWNLLCRLRQRYDHVLLDGPPWEEGLTALASACDGVYLAVRQAKAQSHHAESLVQTIRRQGIRLRGCILAGR